MESYDLLRLEETGIKKAIEFCESPANTLLVNNAITVVIHYFFFFATTRLWFK